MIQRDQMINALYRANLERYTRKYGNNLRGFKEIALMSQCASDERAISAVFDAVPCGEDLILKIKSKWK